MQDLEQRLRLCELQGIEASTEVQAAARRVAEENRQLRELLNRHGVGDDLISHYLQSGSLGSSDAGSASQMGGGNTGAAVQSLEHLIVTRRAASLDHKVAFPLPSQTNHDLPITSAPSNSSSVWDHAQPVMPSHYTHSQPMGVGPGHGPAMTGPPTQSPYPVYSPAPTSGRESFSAQSMGHLPGHVMGSPSGYSGQHLPHETGAPMPYHVPVDPYNDPSAHSFGHPGGL